MKKGYHKTKDGRTVKKGLYYYMNKRKKAAMGGIIDMTRMSYDI